MTDQPLKIGFIGLGIMGAPMAGHLAAAGHRLTLLDEEIEKNLRSVQLRNGVPPSAKLSPDFTVEMETGTGKTYVYLKTAFELNRNYGFTKFVIVVPSVAIKEGVNKTLQITREHFETLYPGAKGYEFFQYDSGNLSKVRNFATSQNVQIMVITVGAINKFGDEQEAALEEADEALRREKSKNVMYRASEKTGGEKPIDLVRASGVARSMNFVSNIAALTVFIISGQVDYIVGLAMGLSVMVGAFFGARTAISGGSKFIRPVFITVVLALTVRLAWQHWFGQA